MEHILLGILAFLIAFSFDLAAIKGIAYLKQVIGLVCVSLFGCSLLAVCLAPVKLRLPEWLAWVGRLFLPVSLFLLVYSLFLEIPFRKTYAATGVGDELVKTGTYALVRHPGVLWLALFLLALVLVSRSRLLLVAVPVWLFMDVLYVWMQERFYFTKMFPGYKQYKRETPMLIPTADSIAECIRTFGIEVRGGKGRRTGRF